MHRFMDELCSNCNKFSYCNNNDLICVSKYKAKEQECDKWESYYELYRIEKDIVKKVQAVINDNPKYGIEFTKNGIIDKDERLSYLELHEQIKLIIDEQAKQLKRKEQECETQRHKLNYYIKKTTQLLDDIDNYKQALEEIEENIKNMNNECSYDDYYRKINILDIINKVKDSE